MKKWMVYYINGDGHREGNEYIHALSKEEAVELYCRFFNVSKYDKCKAIPVIEGFRSES
jgi:hypothetical protein|tara:strand:+ start:5617 stop:5793 length:177 start_codon:yes stop_codon:yes gene_type:complete